MGCPGGLFGRSWLSVRRSRCGCEGVWVVVMRATARMVSLLYVRLTANVSQSMVRRWKCCLMCGRLAPRSRVMSCMSLLWAVCMVEASVAWDGHTVCRSERCLMLLWSRVVRSRLSCGCGILLLFDLTLNLGQHRSLMMRIFPALHSQQLTETNQSTPALVKRTSAAAVLFSLCCSCALSFPGLSRNSRAHWQERPGSRFEAGSPG